MEKVDLQRNNGKFSEYNSINDYIFRFIKFISYISFISFMTSYLVPRGKYIEKFKIYC
jgi:hypothetical protein